MTELIPPEIIPLIWFAGISITVYFFFRKFSFLIVEKIKQTTTAKKRSEQGANTDDQIDNLINSAPRILSELQKEITQQKSNGVTDDQMSGLLRKRDMTQMAVDNTEIIQTLGKPIIKKLVKGIQRWF